MKSYCRRLYRHLSTPHCWTGPFSVQCLYIGWGHLRLRQCGISLHFHSHMNARKYVRGGGGWVAVGVGCWVWGVCLVYVPVCVVVCSTTIRFFSASALRYHAAVWTWIPHSRDTDSEPTNYIRAHLCMSRPPIGGHPSPRLSVIETSTIRAIYPKGLCVKVFKWHWRKPWHESENLIHSVGTHACRLARL